MAREFSQQQRDILRIVQKDLPDSLTPFADIARETGTSEEEVLDLLRTLKEEGVIRRFGASIKHQRTGWNVNAMVAWIVERERVEEVGTKASEHDHVSHCYYRPSSAEDWPYELYTMVHARSNEECTKVIEELRAMTGLGDYLVLTSIRELKKCSPTYF